MSKELIQEWADNEYPKCGDYNTHRYGNDRMNEWVVKNTAEVIKLSDGKLLGFDKPRVETHFCFHDEGAEYELYKDLHASENRMKSYFMSENMKQYDELLNRLEGKKDEYSTFRLCLYNYRNGNYKLTWMSGFNLDEYHIELNEKDLPQVLAVVKKLRADFEKRLNTWWKRYGVDKLKTWTYWADA